MHSIAVPSFATTFRPERAGAGWLFDVGRALIAGLLPFIPGAIIKIALAAALLPCGWTLLDRTR